MASKTKQDQGFTINELMIVLAIAGLIMFIVFLAVTALQRSSRNHQRKHDVALLAAAIGDYQLNNVHFAPNNLKNHDGNPSLIDISTIGNHQNFETVRLAFYNGGGVADNTWGPAADDIYINVSGPVNVIKTPNIAAPGDTGTNANRITDNNISIQAGETCNDTGTGPGQLDKTAVAIFFVLETGANNGSLQCVDA